MSHDVFMSYAREDEQSCRAVEEALTRLGLDVFVDRAIPGGREWERELLRVLQEDQPAVVVLVTADAAASDWVEREVRIAIEQNLTIVPLVVDPAAGQRFAPLLGSRQWIEAPLSAITSQLPTHLVKGLWRALFWSKERERELETLQKEARSWVERTLAPAKELDFWADAHREIFPRELRSAVLVGPGGSGKSLLLAHRVADLLEQPRNLVVVLPPALLRSGLRGVADHLGAPAEADLVEHLRLLEEASGRRIVLVIDGLDTLADIAGEGPVGDTAAVVATLAGAAVVLGACRPEVWEARFAARVSVERIDVPELSERLLDQVLSEPARSVLHEIPFLRLPLFLDLVRQRQSRFHGQLVRVRTRSEFFEWLWSTVAEAGGGAVPALHDSDSFALDRLARLQLARMTYEVPIADTDRAFDALQRAGFAIRRRSLAGAWMVRLRHDLLDCHGMLRRLVDEAAGAPRRRDLYARSAEECGYALLSTLIHYADDTGDQPLKEEVFAHLLDMLDRKGHGKPAMAQAWAASYALRETLPILLPLALTVLGGEVVEPPLPGGSEAENRARGSRLSPPACTQEAASSISSALSIFTPDTALLPERVVPILIEGLGKWTLRARLVEALALYGDPAAVRPLEELALAECGPGDRDRGILAYIALALGKFGQASSVPVLTAIAALPEVSARTRRIALEMRNKILPRTERIPVPRIGDDEIVEELAPRDERGKYTDWTVIRDYSNLVYRRILDGEPPSTRVVEALIGALGHDQTFARVAVADCLALVDGPAARDALVRELLEEAVPFDLARTCLDGLRKQLARESDPAKAQETRTVLLSAARAAAARGQGTTAEELRALSGHPAQPAGGERLHVGEATELLPWLPPRDAVPLRSRCRLVPPEEAPIDAAAQRLLDRTAPGAAGPDRERKLRLVRAAWQPDGTLEADLVETTWTAGRTFHLAMLAPTQDMEELAERGRWLDGVLAGRPRVPNLAVVHGIVLTADGKVLLAQRSQAVAYAPGHWSASFEEQLTVEDLDGGPDAAANAARRGFREEFELEVPAGPEPVQVLSALVELGTLNSGFVVLIRPGFSFESIQRAWRNAPAGSDAAEARALAALDATPTDLERAISGASPHQPLHPTSALRLAILARWLRAATPLH